MNHFKPGDYVTVIKEGSYSSRELLGKSFFVYSVKYHSSVRMHYVLSSPDCDGIWEDEIELHPASGSPLLKALE